MMNPVRRSPVFVLSVFHLFYDHCLFRFSQSYDVEYLEMSGQLKYPVQFISPDSCDDAASVAELHGLQQHALGCYDFITERVGGNSGVKNLYNVGGWPFSFFRAVPVRKVSGP